LLKDPENDIVHPKGLKIPLLDFSRLDSDDDDDGELKHSKNKKPEIQQNTSIISLSHFSAPNNDDSEKENAKNGSNKDNETQYEDYMENQQRSAEFKMSNGQMNGDNSAPSESAKSVCSSLTLSTPDRLSILKINHRRRRLVVKNGRTMSCERVGKSSSSSSSCRENDEKVCFKIF